MTPLWGGCTSCGPLCQTLNTLNGTGSTHAQDFVQGVLHPDRGRACLLLRCVSTPPRRGTGAPPGPAAVEPGDAAAEVWTPVVVVGAGSDFLWLHTCRLLICSCCRQCTCRQAIAVAPLCKVSIKHVVLTAPTAGHSLLPSCRCCSAQVLCLRMLLSPCSRHDCAPSCCLRAWQTCASVALLRILATVQGAVSAASGGHSGAVQGCHHLRGFQ